MGVWALPPEKVLDVSMVYILRKKPVANFNQTSKTLAMQTLSGFLVRSFITREISGHCHDPWLGELNLIILLLNALVFGGLHHFTPL